MEEQEFELSYMEKTQEFEPRQVVLETNSQLVEEEAKLQEINETSLEEIIENNKNIQEEIVELGEDFELSKTKVKDSLSDICKTKSENITKCQVKADIAVQSLRKKLQSNLERRSSLVEFLSECDLQTKYVQAQASVEEKDRTQIEKEMQAAENILSAARDNIQCQEVVLLKYKTELEKYEKDAKDFLNEVMLFKKSQEKIESNKLLIERSRAELELKQSDAMMTRNELLNRIISSEQIVRDLETQLVFGKNRNEELLKQQDVFVQEINESKQELSKLKDELNSVELNELRKKFENLKEDTSIRIYAKNNEMDILKQRLLLRKDYLLEWENKLIMFKNKNLDLTERKNELSNDVVCKRIAYEEFLKKQNENRLIQKENLDMLLTNKEELERNLQEIELNISVTVQNVDQLEKQLDTLQKQMSEKSSELSSLSTKEEMLKAELEELANVYETHNSQEILVQDKNLCLKNEIDHLTTEKLRLENELETRRTAALTEISNLNNELDLTKNTEKEIELKAIQIESDKIKSLEELRILKENNEAKLTKIRINLEDSKNVQVSLQATIDDINVKLQMKTERRDALYNQFTQCQQNIDRLELDIKNAKENTKNSSSDISKLGSFQKPTGILKHSNVKSPQKKVTFDKNINWETLSESSTDALFANIFQKTANQTVKKRKMTTSSDDIFDMLRRNSPPERESHEFKI